MSLSESTNRVQYRCDGTATAFTVPFYFLEDSHLRVYKYNQDTLVETQLDLTTDYTVTGAGESSGGTVTLVAALSADHLLTIIRNVPITQAVDYRENDLFRGNTLEQALDKITMILQQLDELVRRGVVLKVTTSGEDVEFSPGGYIGGFPASIDSVVDADTREFAFTEVEPLSTGGFQIKSGGVTGTAFELESGDPGWSASLPVYAHIFIHSDSEDNLIYIFETPKLCA